MTVVAASAAIVGPIARAQGSDARPITDENFEQAAPRGFGDRNNSWAQSMAWWNGNLYVGTARQSGCTSLYSIYQFAAGLFGKLFADTWLTYPPPNSDLLCAPDGADLSLQAEIWRWAPGNDSWIRVFQSPLDLDNPGTGGSAPPRTGKKLPYEIAFRGLAGHTEPDGTEALYAFGVNSTIMWDRSKLPPPRILRSVDGLNFIPIPQTPGTFLGDLPFNPDHSSFRSPVSLHGKLFVIAGPVFGQGQLIGSSDPAKGDDAWFLADTSGTLFYELAAFNGWLYVGTIDASGYSVFKLRVDGNPPYQLVPVIPKGAFLTKNPSKSVVSMNEYAGQLYVGTATYTEIIRINPDDTWDVVVGSPRQVPLPGGGVEWKYPLSGLEAGFGHTLNDHAWQMDDPYRQLFIGTYNAATGSKNDPVHGPLLEHNMGAHLYKSPDGWYYSALTTNGFKDPADPYGGPFDFGIRTMAATPHGAFLGTANDAYGLAIFRATPHGSNKPQPPERLEIEPNTTGSALLSWKEDPTPDQYQIWRAEIHPIYVRDDLNFENWNGISGNKIPDTYVGPYVQVGVTSDTVFVDSTVSPGSKYMYYVLRVRHGRVSGQSNLVAFPLITPPVTFARMLREIERIEERQRFLDPVKRMAPVRTQVQAAQALANVCLIPDAIMQLKPRQAATNASEPEATDVEILMSKLVRRLTLYNRFPQDVLSDEFCAYH